MTDQPSDFGRFMIFLTMLVLTALVAQAQGLLIGASTDFEVFMNAISFYFYALSVFTTLELLFPILSGEVSCVRAELLSELLILKELTLTISISGSLLTRRDDIAIFVFKRPLLASNFSAFPVILLTHLITSGASLTCVT